MLRIAIVPVSNGRLQVVSHRAYMKQGVAHVTLYSDQLECNMLYHHPAAAQVLFPSANHLRKEIDEN